MTMPEPRAPRHVPLAYVMRSGLVESVHHGSMVVLAPDGSVRYELGDPGSVMYPRSSMKPVQATAMTRLGLDLPADLLALAASSHSGERYHLDGARKILVRHGLSEDDLRNPVSMPLDPEVRDEWIAAGRAGSRVAQNCSGKHAAMLATVRGNGWSLSDYLEPDHPLQKEIARTAEDLSGEPVAHVAVDGCGAPLFALSLTGLARAVARIAAGAEGSAEHAVAEAIRAHPNMLGGSNRPVTELIRAVPELIAKDGYEGVMVAAMPDRSVVAVKIADGSGRARTPVTAAGLAMLGVPDARLAPFFEGARDDQADGVVLVPELRQE
ncbi:MAG: asparaginase [Actinophytocola sp.]|nr:asparaginase [Actinophytocola sp.]